MDATIAETAATTAKLAAAEAEVARLNEWCATRERIDEAEAKEKVRLAREDVARAVERARVAEEKTSLAEARASDAEARASDAASVSELREALAATEARAVAAETSAATESASVAALAEELESARDAESALADARRAAAESAANLARVTDDVAALKVALEEARADAANARASPAASPVTLTVVARETEEDVATLQARLRETERELADAVARLSAPSERTPSAFVNPPGSPSPAILAAIDVDSPVPHASPPARVNAAQRSTHRAVAKTRLSETFQSEFNADGTPRDLEAALSSAVKGNIKGHESDPNSPTGGVFRGWRDSRVLGRASTVRMVNPCFDASDKAVAAGMRLMRAHPMMRFAGIAYWFALHLWLFMSLTLQSHAVTMP